MPKTETFDLEKGRIRLYVSTISLGTMEAIIEFCDQEGTAVASARSVVHDGECIELDTVAMKLTLTFDR